MEIFGREWKGNAKISVEPHSTRQSMIVSASILSKQHYNMIIHAQDIKGAVQQGICNGQNLFWISFC